jgi:ATP-dependent DNA ligase
MSKGILLDTIYKKTKTGKLQQWTVWTDGATIYTEHGQVGGQLQLDEKIVKGKNIGKKNETSPEDQAEKEAIAMRVKRLKKDYSETIEEAKLGKMLPMLAKDFTKRSGTILYPAYIQPKLDGCRCLAYRDETGKVVMKTRGGSFWDVRHIEEDLNRVLQPGVVLDGELYVHGMSFQKITSLLKRHQADSTKLQFHVYDIFTTDNPDEAYEQRMEKLKLFFIRNRPHSLIQVETRIVRDEDSVYQQHKRFVDYGYEGSIIRQAKGIYDVGNRSNDLLKLKNFDDHEFKVISYRKGQGRYMDAVIFECEVKSGLTFEVNAPGSLEDKRNMALVADDLMGKMLKVQHFGWTNDGKPRFPTPLGFRLEEDMDS